MNASQIKKMNGDECFKEITRIEALARINGKEITAANKKVIKLLEQRLDDLDPERED